MNVLCYDLCEENIFIPELPECLSAKMVAKECSRIGKKSGGTTDSLAEK
jgi:hypothetical protein